MTERIVTDEHLGQLARRQNDLFRRVREGTLPVADVLGALQRVIEGDFGTPVTLVDQGPYRGHVREAGAGKDGLTWRVQDGVIYLPELVSDGTAGEVWIPRLEGKGFRVSDYAKSVLRSPDFRPTDGVTYGIAVLPGKLFSDADRSTSKIRADAERRGFTKPHPEVACLIREKFSDDDLEDMGFWWLVTMHEAIEDKDGAPRLLDAYRFGGGRWLGADYDGPGDRWGRDDGFAFSVPQAGPCR